MGRLTVLLVLLSSSCVARWQTVSTFSDEAALPEEYVGYSHRVWREDDRILVEIDQIPGIKVAIIEADIRSDGLYLFPLRASVGSGGKTIVPVDVAVERLPQDWFDKTYWVTSVEPPRRVRANVTAHWRRVLSSKSPQRKSPGVAGAFTFELPDVDSNHGHGD